MNIEDKNAIIISKESELNKLVERINDKKCFGEKVRFSNTDLFKLLLKRINISCNDFDLIEDSFYFDPKKKLHISKYVNGDIWIIANGLIAEKYSSNEFVNSCRSQYFVVSLLYEKAIEKIEKSRERVYDVNSIEYEYLCSLFPAIFHNTIFYIELFFKAYLSLNDIEPKKTHKIIDLYEETLETKNKKKHNNTMFEVCVSNLYNNFIQHIKRLPEGFKEHFVKYDNNENDPTVLIYDIKGLSDFKEILSQSYYFILEFHEEGENAFIKLQTQ